MGRGEVVGEEACLFAVCGREGVEESGEFGEVEGEVFRGGG